MTISPTRTYQENRNKFPLDELRRYDGQWVAFSTDGRRVVASASSIAEVAARLDAAHERLENVVLEHIELESNEISLGAAELL